MVLITHAARRVRTHEDEWSDQKSHWMVARAPLKNEFTEDEKYHNLMTWLNQVLCYVPQEKKTKCAETSG